MLPQLDRMEIVTAPRPDRSDQAALAAPDSDARVSGPATTSAATTAASRPRRFGAPAALAGVAAIGLVGLASLAGLALASEPAERTERTEPTGSSSAAPGSRAVDERLGDIQSLYAWMDADATHVNLVMTLSPFDDGTATFGPGFQYVFHIGVHSSPSTPSIEDEMVLCQFLGATEIECWVGNTYLRGNPSLTDGLTSDNGLVRVFAGRRSDPFFFNESGFENARAQLRTFLPPTLPPADDAECPAIAPAAAAGILAKLRTPPVDRFADTNVLALVMIIDKRNLGVLPVTPLLSVWGSTHRQ